MCTPRRVHSTFVLFGIAAIFIGALVEKASSEGCTEDHPFCGFWAANKECTNNPAWMLPNCKVSCRQCQPSSGGSRRPSEGVNAGDNRRVSAGVNAECPRIQIQEVSTRITPDGNQYRQRAFRDGCGIPNQPNICSQNICYHKRFRTFDGSCNNLRDPMKGSAYTPFARLLPPNYEDGIGRMHGLSPRSLPNPREVTFLLISSRIALPSHANSLLMQMGQFLSHDITRNTLINTCMCDTRGPQCANMPVSRLDTKRAQCIPFTRSLPLCGTGIRPRPREQMNENTGFIDASHIYGSDPRTQAALRVGALLRTSLSNSGPFPPPAQGGENVATGDDRSNLFIGLAAMHTIFLRLHNRIATDLARMNRHWNQDRTYQETRTIVGGILQSITYKEFVPTLLGGKFNRLVRPYSGYRPNVDPSVSNEFAASAYRLHGLILEFYPLVDRQFRKVGDVRFVDGTGQVRRLLSTGTDLLVRGMITAPARKPQRITTQVTEDLFGLSDMSSLNIQRGRDHGLSTYNDYRELCKLPKLTSFDDWKQVSDVAVRRRVAELYGSPDKIDLYVGGLLEEPSEGSLLGETFSCIMAEQFSRTRDGDRFYYENQEMYSRDQIKAIQQVTLARVICDTGENFPAVPRNAFLVDTGANAVRCADIPAIDLGPWRE